MSDENMIPAPVILFDGVCNLCNASVDFIIRHDPGRYYKFASLQSDAGQQLKERYDLLDSLYSVILIENDQVYDKSTAALKIAKHLSFPWNLFHGFIYLPRTWRDRMYAYIARNRYQWFGKRESCRIPTQEEKDRFLN
jgi:predicted DCC family thiol-disulfide oxidoreductase YuxK